MNFYFCTSSDLFCANKWIRRQICDSKSCGLWRWMYKKSKGCETGKTKPFATGLVLLLKSSLSWVRDVGDIRCWWRTILKDSKDLVFVARKENRPWDSGRVWPKCDITVTQICFDLYYRLYKMRHSVCHMINVFKLVNQGTSDRSLLSIHFWFSPRFTRKPHFIDLLMAFWRVMSNFA